MSHDSFPGADPGAAGSSPGEQLPAAAGDANRVSPAYASDPSLFRSLFETSQAGMVIVTLEGRISAANPAFCQFLGFPAGELAGLPVTHITAEEDRPQTSETLATLAGGRAARQALQKRYRHRQGHVVWGLTAATAVVDSTGQPARLVAVIQDITDHKRTQAALRQSVEELAAINAVSCAVNTGFALDRTATAALGAMLKAAQADLAFLFVRENERLILREQLPPTARERLGIFPEHRVGECLCGLAVRERKPIYCRDIGCDPRCTWDECKRARLKSLAALPLRNGDEITGVIALGSSAEQDFQARSAFLEIMTSQVAVGLANARLYETARNEVRERQQSEAMLRLDEARLQALLKLSEMNGASLDEITAFALEQAVALTQSQVGYVAFANEDETILTMHAWSAEALRQCKMDAFPRRFVVAETGLWGEPVRQRRPVITNDCAAPHPARKGFPEGHAPVRRHLGVPILDQGRIVMVAGVGNKAGDYNEADIRQITLLMGGTWQALQREKAQKALRRIEWMLSKHPGPLARDMAPEWTPEWAKANTCRVILEAVTAPILTDVVSDFLDLLDTAAAVHERNGDCALGIVSSGWCRLMAEASLRQCGEVAPAPAGGKWICHAACWAHGSKISLDSGEAVDVECGAGIRIHAVPIRAGGELVGSISVGYGDPPRDPAVLEELAARFGVELDQLRQAALAYETRPPYIVELAKRRLRASARLIGEIVERKRAEEHRQRLEEQLRYAQKMESIGRLAGGVAHDFNNMLQAILGNAELAMTEAPPGALVSGCLEEIKKSARRSADLTRQLLAFARKQTIQPRVLDLNDTIASLLKMLRRLIGENVQLVCLPGPGLWPVKADPGQIDQVLANLAVNARDAIAGVGRLTITTANVVVGSEFSLAHPACGPGEYVRLSVSDTGRGMDAETCAHLFEPFFTTKDVGKGTGLGLATVFGIMEQNHGTVEVRSAPGQGTTFELYWPRAVTEAAASEAPLSAASLRGTETILLVEDEEQILNLGRRILEQHGYAVIAAFSPEAALVRAVRAPERIHLLITDVILPGMNGKELLARLEPMHPGLKCLFLSGYPAPVLAEHGVSPQGPNFLAKPFDAATLLGRIRDLLAPESG